MIKRRILVAAVTLAIMALSGAVSAPAAEINRTTTLTDDLRAEPSETDLTSPQFDAAIEDLPLMPGLGLMQNNDVVFGSGSGRIVESDAIGPVDIDDVYRFYRRTLPHLGWKILDARSYCRENDILRIDAHADGKTTLVHFSIKPNSATK